MPNVGLKDLYYAKITENAQTHAVTYAAPTRMAKAIAADISVEFAESELYADDALDCQDKEFAKGTIKLNVNDLESSVRADILGETVETDGTVVSNINNFSPEVAVGFRAKKSGAAGRYRYVWLYRVKFAPPSESYQTKGASIEYKTPEIEGTIAARADGNWKIDWTGLETESKATGWFTAVPEPSET